MIKSAVAGFGLTARARRTHEILKNFQSPRATRENQRHAPAVLSAAQVALCTVTERRF